MVCPKCGQANADNLNFCAACGQKLERASASSAGAIPVNPPRAGTPAPTGSVPPQPPPGVQPLQPPGYAPPPAAPLSAPAPLYNPPPGPQSLTGEPLPPPAAPAQMQCRVCGTVLTPRDYSCPRCNTPVGMVANPNDSTAGTYLPVGGYQPMFENTSGQKSTVPPEIASYKWSWGAFLLNWIWLCFHGMALWGIALLVFSFIPLVGLIANIYLGINGHKLAWQNRRYDSIEQYKKVETAWMRWGIGIVLVGIAFFLMAIIVGSIGVESSSTSFNTP